MPTPATTPPKMRHEVELYLRRERVGLQEWAKMDPCSQYRRWLDALGLTYDKFARACNLPYNTVFKWGQGRQPRPTCLELVKITYPDCPLVLAYLSPAAAPAGSCWRSCPGQGRGPDRPA